MVGRVVVDRCVDSSHDRVVDEPAENLGSEDAVFRRDAPDIILYRAYIIHIMRGIARTRAVKTSTRASPPCYGVGQRLCLRSDRRF